MMRLVVPLCLLLAGVAGAAERWGPFRGANGNPGLSAKDIQDFAANGGNLLRASMSGRPLMQKTPPYAIDEASFAVLDSFLARAEQYGVKVVIDPHTAPGFADPFTTFPTDIFWSDTVWHDHLVRLWEYIANRYKDRGAVIAGYDLLNEPAVPNGGARGTPADWNALVRRLVAAIRAIDPVHTIIVEPPMIFTPGRAAVSRLAGMAYLDPPPAGNLVYSPHMYEPLEFTHQGVNGRPEPVAYPGIIGGKRWDRAAMEVAFEPVVAFQQKHGVPIYIAEFSATRWRGGDANRYIRDVIELCEKNGWSWGYHAWRAADVWDAEMDNENRSNRQRLATTPRLEILKSFWARNANLRRPVVASGGLVNGASFLAGPVAPGEIISVFGQNLGPEEMVTNRYGDGSMVGGTRVLIDGREAAIIFASSGQVAAVAPALTAFGSTATLVVESETPSDPVEVTVAEASPGIFTRNSSGSGQAVAFNADGQLNDGAAPAPRGSAVTVYATGLATGAVAVGGIEAETLQWAPVPSLPGVTAATIRLPDAGPAGTAVPLVLKSGGAVSQPGVTLAVR